ncbi:CDP-diacylglycerol--inositol 3-phosphatidyltransferase-like isoform X2 [Ptychodera flava]|uniref:CDP-diacylglycerol--inositol 3-phosphatidyltransferase-like isoform X2 n=1 Tax=Ptychodera flava TaxID=63121 RepID=UPI00396A6A31
MAENIFLFVPNVIGYARIILNIISFWYMPTDYVLAIFCYVTSALLDAFDGHAARALNQATKFGAMLDQLTDRAATMCLLVVLSHFYPKWMFVFQMSMTIDIVCHWLHLHSCNMIGMSSHKKIDASGNPIMHLYYTSKPVLFFMCAGNELCYSSLYVLNFTEGPSISFLFFSIGLWRLLFYICIPVAVVKSAISILHLIIASRNIAIVDVAERSKGLKIPEQ